MLTRRSLLTGAVLPLLDGCAAPLPPLPASASTPEAEALLAASAAAHGLAALSSVQDINVRYDGHFRGLVGSLVPVLVDAGFRGRSEERYLPHDRFVAQSYTGRSGHKEVVRRTVPHGEGDVQVWFNGEPSQDLDQRHAAALVADGYNLFLLGPMLLAGPWSNDRSLVFGLGAAQTITAGGRDYTCDVLRVRVGPGIGLSGGDDLAVFIDRDERLMRRVRFSMHGLDATQGAVAEVDTWDHAAMGGIRWPTQFHEQLLRPLPIAVHDWRMEGLDLNRALQPADIEGEALSPRAAVPAQPLPSV